MHILKMIPFSVLCAGIFMSPAWSASAPDIRYVVIDPGHTPLKYGATGASGTVEFDYNTRFSHELAEALEKEQIPFIFSNVRNPELSLTDRVKLTNKNSLFIAIHHDSVQQGYCNISYDPCITDYAAGYSLFVSERNPYFRASADFAKKIARDIRRQGIHPSIHHGEHIPHENRKLLDESGVYQFDDLIVLKHARSPAVLIEIGVITNPGDERNINLKSYRSKIIGSIVKALKAVMDLRK